LGILRKIAAKELFKVTSLNSVSVLLKIGVGLITSKVLAVFVGPSGMALVGNFRNFITSLESVSTLGFQNGIVKYVAESKEDLSIINRIIATIFISLFGLSFFLSIGLFVFSEYWSAQIFGGNETYFLVFKGLAIALPWYASSVFLSAVINGLGHYKRVIYINIISNIIGLVASVVLVMYYKTIGAMFAMVLTPSLLFFVSYYVIHKNINLFHAIRFSHFDVSILKNLSSFSLMALVSSVVGPMVFLAVRNYVIQAVGINQAGYWETISRISSYYLMFVTTILSIYYLPKLSVAKTKKETKKVFIDYYKFMLPLFIVGVVILYFSRFYIIQILFTKEFLPVANLFFWQLLGDVLKVASLILGYNLLAKK